MSFLASAGEILLVLFFVFLNGFFVAAEFAIVKVRSTQIEPLVARGNRRAKIANGIITHLDAYLSATQLGITIASLALGWLGEPLFAAMLTPTLINLGITNDQAVRFISFGIAFVIITTVHIVIGEQSPKILAIQKAKSTILWISLPLRMFYGFFRPLISAINFLSNFVLRMVGIEIQDAHELEHSEEELRLLLLQDKGVSLANRLLLLNAMDFRKKQARHCMVPRIDMVALSYSAPVAKNLEIMRTNKFSRYPVYKETIDNVTGIVHTKDIFKADRDHRSDFTLDSILRDVIFLPETAPLEKVLETMVQKKVHMILLVDEFGGTAGLITMENVLEELVGTIQDEFDRELPEVTKVNENEFLVDASLTTNDVERLINQELSIRDIQSIGAFVIERLGHFPGKGESVDVNGAQFIVERVDDRVIETVRVKKIPVVQETEDQ